MVIVKVVLQGRLVGLTRLLVLKKHLLDPDLLQDGRQLVVMEEVDHGVLKEEEEKEKKEEVKKEKKEAKEKKRGEGERGVAGERREERGRGGGRGERRRKEEEKEKQGGEVSLVSQE